MSTCREPKKQLRPFVALLWSSDEGTKSSGKVCQELVLPSGAMHLAIRLGDCPIRVFSRSDQQAIDFGTAVIGGVRDSAFRKELVGPSVGVGAVLRPGVAELLSGAPAGALAHRHTRLDDMWGGSKLAELRERLAAAPTPEGRVLVLEEALAQQLPSVRGIDPLIAHMLAQLDRGLKVSELVRDSGFSHRHLALKFTQAVGIGPKSYQRLRRFNRVLDQFHRGGATSFAEAAAAYGFADQAHMNREFLRFTGLTPGAYLRIAPADARHVAIPPELNGGQFRSIQGRTRPAHELHSK